jgi:Domain of unknown function (DUF5916)/Carbohydrate family 9 binding domain-like
MKLTNSMLLLALFSISSILAQETEKKSLTISKTDNPPVIDGVLNDAAWQNLEEAKDFIQFRPEMGIKDTIGIQTNIKVTYDNNAIYFGAYLHDDPTKIMKQLTTRDDFGQTDFLGIIINPNNDAQNDTEFFIFPSGTQADAIANPSIGEDFGWNAVWESKVTLVEDGWIVEVKIPYDALRFSNENVQTWGLQFHRHFRRASSQYTWNPVDRTKGNFGLYHGELKGIENIESPIRLSFYPFTSGLVNSFDGNTDTDLNFGLDLKYGITENFTLDATLVPDFSQAGFDNLELNLGPFEQTFSEQRQFFTEGVDLFSKGNLFFSRRVGNSPTGSVTLNANEEVEKYPNTVNVLNAVKVSGRTKNGLGIGIFNAITEKTYATIKNTETNVIRNELVEPISNYNILVVDQQFNKNSSVSLINTNVTRDGKFRDANVTGLLFDISNKRNTYNLQGETKMSNLNLADSTSTGYSTYFSARKSHGNFRYGIDHSYADTKYDINDLGLIYRNNYNNAGIDLSYRIFEPTKKLNNYYIGGYYNYNRLADPGVYTGSGFGVNYNAQTKTLHNFGANINMQPGKQFDYFEPRTTGRYFIYENRLNSGVWFSSNYNKTFAYDFDFGGLTYFDDTRDSNEFWFGIQPRVRFNDKLLITYSYNYNKEFNDRGYATKVGDDIIFGERDRKTIVNSLSGSYTFNSFNSLSLTFRNYWSIVDYKNDFFTLEDNGMLNAGSGYELSDLANNPNANFNTWNLDFSYSWQFAPGSFLTALYRNQLFNYDNNATDTYSDSLDTLFNQPIQHTFSLRLQYFINYSSVKNIFEKKHT